MEAVEAKKLQLKATRLAWFGYFVALSVWLVLSYGELFRLLGQGRLFALYIGGRPFVSDFVMYYNAAVLAESSTAGSINIYSPAVQHASLLKLIAPVVPELPFYLQYPPLFFALVRPLASLSLTAAWELWCVAGLLLLVVAIYHCLAEDSWKGWFRRTLPIVAVLSAYPTWHCFRVGQASLFVLPLMVMYWTLLRRERNLAAGLATGLMMVKLQYAPLTALVGCLLGRVRFAAGVVLSAALCILVSGWTLGWANVANYPAALLKAETSGLVSGVQTGTMQNVLGALVLLTGTDSPLARAVCVLALLLAAIAVVFLWVKIFKRLDAAGDEAFNVCSSFTVLILLVTSPHTHVQDFLLAALPCLWIYPLVAGGTGHRPGPERAIQVMIVSAPVLTWVFYLWREQLSLWRVQPFFLWAVVMTILLGWMVRDRLSGGENRS